MLNPSGHGSVHRIDGASFARAAEDLTNSITSVRPDLAELDCRPRGDSGLPPAEVPPAEADRCLDELLGGIIACMGAAKGNIQVFDARHGVLRMRAHKGFSPAFVKYFDTVRVTESACGLALYTRGTVLVSDVATSPVFTDEARQVVLQEDVRAVQSTNLACAESRPVGVVSVHYRRPGLPPDSQDLLRRFAPRLAEIVSLSVHGTADPGGRPEPTDSFPGR